MNYKPVYLFRWVIIAAFIFLIFVCNFVQIKLYFLGISFPKTNLSDGLLPFLGSLIQKLSFKLQDYNMQILVVWCTGVILGSLFGTIALSIYILLGFLGLPVFAGGGGFDYYKEPTFGYLIALPLNAFFAGYLWERNKILFSVMLPVMFNHLCGILYLLLFNRAWLQMSWYMSFSMIGYDLIFAFLMLPVLPALIFLFREISIQEILVIDKKSSVIKEKRNQERFGKFK